MISQAEKDSLELEYNLALRALQNAKAGNNFGLEQRYGHAYQALVRAGLRTQIKGKYRRV